MIAILDYGSGNLRSAERAFQIAAEKVVVTQDPKVCRDARALVVPGVGAFAACMDQLLSVGGAEIIAERVAASRPIFGICVGMQIFFDSSSEKIQKTGLGILSGNISEITAPILPHMGWNTLETNPDSILFNGIESESFYFVHSYAAKKAVGKTQAWSTHGEKFLAAVEDGYISATQFHPEKSGLAGLALIKNWVGSL